ncbi:MAG: oxygenase MpaB family protein [Solirubrobacteraceae bacterium]
MKSSTSAADSLAGYFPKGTSLLRRVMRERAVNLLYGQRALMIGALQPIGFIGTTQRSTAHANPWRRLVHTAQMFDAVFFGTREQADRALAFTHRLHERVNGTIEVQAGPYGPQTPYSALDPELMLWVTAPTFDSARVLYEVLVRRLSPGEREQLYREYVTWGELFGMPREAMPATYDGFRDWWPAILEGDGIFLTDEARTVGLNIGLRMPAPAHLRPAMTFAGFLIVGSLPPVVRDAYGLNWSAAQRLAYDTTALSLRRARPLVPAGLRRGSSTEAYKLLERTERSNLRAGKQSFGPVD